MAHVTYVWSLDATRPAVAYDTTRRPETQETHLLELRLPDAGLRGILSGVAGNSSNHCWKDGLRCGCASRTTQ